MNRDRDHSHVWRAAMRGLLLAGAVPAVLSAQQPATAAPSLVFDGVTVVDVKQGKLVPAQRVVITGNRIQTMGAAGAVKMPKGAQVVEARGKYLIPGLWDMHVHTMAYISHLLFLANGVTGIRDAWADVPLDTMIQWRREILAGTRVGPPRQLLSGVAINSENACVRQKNGWTGHICVSSVDSADARQLVESLQAAGADMLKTYALSKETYHVLAAAARRVGIPFGGHLHGQGGAALTAIEASDIGAAIIDHNDIASGGLGARCLNYTRRSSVEECQPIAERFRQNNTWSVPTTLNAIGPAARSIKKYFNDFVSRFWQSDTVLRPYWGPGSQRAPNDSLGSMHVVRRVGLPILAGTDAMLRTDEYIWSNPGFYLHGLLALYVTEGLSPLEALQTATLNPAKFLHATDSLGTVAPGKLADLVLLDADPLADITNTMTIRAVVANGRYFDRAALDALLAEVQAKVKQQP